MLFERFPKFLVRLEQVKGTHLMRKKIKDVPRVCAGPIPRDLVVGDGNRTVRVVDRWFNLLTV